MEQYNELTEDSSHSDNDELMDDDDSDFIMLFFFNGRTERVKKSPIFRRRWDSDYLLPLAHNENSFIQEYRMPYCSFLELHSILVNRLTVNEKMARISTPSAPISTVSRLGAALIMLGGGRSMEAMRTHGLARDTVYKNLRKVVRAIISEPRLAIVCDNSETGLQERAARFKEKSDFGLMECATGAIDGLTFEIICPKNVLNQTMYFSGGKQMYCVNMQAVCDSNGLFLAVSCKHVGSTHDSLAFDTGGLKNLCSGMIPPYHWAGDNAYTLSRTMMVPFPGMVSAEEESMNYYISQLRITIERAFGILVQRWGIFWSALKFKISFVLQLIEACCRLHNFCLARNLPILNKEGSLPDSAKVNSRGILEDNRWRTNERWNDGSNVPFNVLRNRLVDKIAFDSTLLQKRNIQSR
jgi:hypothetical protein